MARPAHNIIIAAGCETDVVSVKFVFSFLLGSVVDSGIGCFPCVHADTVQCCLCCAEQCMAG